jgi:PKD repeat protein
MRIVHILLFKLFLLIFLLASITESGAQAMSGTYTIGTGSANYSSFTNAVSNLVTKGISGPVIFKVAAGNYNESITIPAIPGSSATNTITFSGAGISTSGTRIYYSLSTSGSAVIFFNACSYVTLDHITIENTSTSTTSYPNYPACIRTLLDTNITISNCNIKTAISTSTFYNVVGIHFYNSMGAVLTNSHISGGLFGLLNEGSSKSAKIEYGSILVKNNRFAGAYYNHVYGFGYPYGLMNDVYDGNVFDSSTSPYISAYQLSYENGATIKNSITNGNVASYLPIEIDFPNYGTDSLPFVIVNNMIGNFQYQGLFIDGSTSAIANMNLHILHNTFDEENNKPSNIVYADLSKSGGMTFENNILSTTYSAIPFYLKTPKIPSGILIDGNNYYSGGGSALVTFNNSAYTSISSFKGAVASLGWSLYDNSIKPHFTSKKDLHLDQLYFNPSGVYAGIDIDIDGDARCKLFPTAGADESTYGMGTPVVAFYLPAKIYPNSPTYVYQIAKAGEPKRHSWYVNGVHVSDSIVLLTNKFNVGTNTLKLVTVTCFSSDSSTQTFTVSPPTTVPGTDFISDKNRIKTGDIVSFQDLTTGGPTRWLWTISPDTVVSGGLKIPAIQYIYGNPGFQNPQVKFLIGGTYKVCLSTYNSIGKGPTICKKDYVIVSPSYNLGSTSIVHDSSGYLFDNGGAYGDYSFDSKVESILIDPCADSVYLTFSAFDLYCGYDYLRLYEGRNNTGKNISGKCTNIGSFTGYGQGFTGGKAYPGGCGFQCMPDITKPDTFKAKNSIYIEMKCYAAYQSAGFAAYWWSKPRKSAKTKPSFTVSADSICTNQSLSFTNTTKIDPVDPATFLWDLDGDPGTFECIGTCASAIYAYYIPGPITITLIAINCGGADSTTHTITAFNPDPPRAKPVADDPTPTLNEIVFFSEPTATCIDKYRWNIKNSNPLDTGKALYINSTTSISSAPQVLFTDTGYYDVSLYVENEGGMQKDSVSIKNYIHVIKPYCIPSVDTLISDIGIYKVEFNTMSKVSIQAAQGYTDYINNPSYTTTVTKELNYNLSVYRKFSPKPTPINRTVYIDWNGDGNFTGKGEIVLSDSNSTSAFFTKTITIPKSAISGAVVMRVAVNKGTFSNKPCGKNETGEYQDYRIHISPYNILPVISLKGKQGFNDTLIFDIGHDFPEPGDSASSFLYGNITKNIIRTSQKLGSTNPNDTFNKNIPDIIYVFSYNATDPEGNKAITKYRIVKVTNDKTPPDLVVELPDTILIAVTAKPQYPIHFPKVISSIDLIDGSRTVTIDTPHVFTNIVGNYIVTYTSSDTKGNTIKVYRVIKVTDSIKPKLILNGSDTVTIEVFNSYKDAGLQYSDNYYANATLTPLLKMFSDIDTAKTGIYHIVYSITDPSGNKGIAVRTIKVVDTIKPVININGPLSDSVEVFHPYLEKGFSVSDNYDSVNFIARTISGTYYLKFGTKIPDSTGVFTIIYTATDRAGNRTVVTRIVKVQDRTPPVILLAGPAQVSVCRWFPYIDAGYTLFDNYDKITDIKVDTFGSYFTKKGTDIPNYLDIRYKARDRAGNISISDPRIILVKPSTDKECISGSGKLQSIENAIKIYPNPNNGRFTIQIASTGLESPNIRIENVLGQVVQPVTPLPADLIIFRDIEVDLSNQPAGIYFLELQTKGEIVRVKVETGK